MKVLGIIPAREGSKRVPGKNMRIIGGKPLTVWIIDAALGSKTVDTVVVSTDSGDVLSLAEKYNDERLSFVERPAEISRNDSPAIDYVRHVLDSLKESYDVIVILQPSSPFTEPADIDGTVNLLEKSGADTAVSVVRLSHDVNPVKMKVMEGDKLKPFVEEEKGRMEEGTLPDIYVRNCSVYATKIEVIESGRIIGDDCRGYVMPRERSVDINDEFDFLFAEFLSTKLSEVNR